MNPLIPAIITTIVDTVAPGLSDGELPAAQQPVPSVGVVRAIPQDAPKAEMEPPLAGQVIMGDTAMSLSAGAQIRDQMNRIVMPSTVTERHIVRFKLDPAGQVSQVWILTPEERQQPAPTFR